MSRLPAGAATTPVILATGDSFTEGDEVDDDETWPAYLQGISGRRTLNAGVSGFAFDQTVLRTEQMLARAPVAVAVVGFIVDDMRRNEMSRAWDVNKPYFELNGGNLLLRNSPVPPPRASCNTLPFWQHAFGWSVMIDGIARRGGWMVDWIFDNVYALPRGAGRELGCPLMRRLGQLGVPTLIVAQYDRTVFQAGVAHAEENHREALRLLDCAALAGMPTFDTFEAVRQAIALQGLDALYLIGHHTPAGNRLTARIIADELARRALLPAAK